MDKCLPVYGWKLQNQAISRYHLVCQRAACAVSGETGCLGSRTLRTLGHLNRLTTPLWKLQLQLNLKNKNKTAYNNFYMQFTMVIIEQLNKKYCSPAQRRIILLSLIQQEQRVLKKINKTNRFGIDSLSQFFGVSLFKWINFNQYNYFAHLFRRYIYYSKNEFFERISKTFL